MCMYTYFLWIRYILYHSLDMIIFSCICSTLFRSPGNLKNPRSLGSLRSPADFSLKKCCFVYTINYATNVLYSAIVQYHLAKMPLSLDQWWNDPQTCFLFIFSSTRALTKYTSVTSHTPFLGTLYFLFIFLLCVHFLLILVFIFIYFVFIFY